MNAVVTTPVVLGLIALAVAALSVRIVEQYEQGAGLRPGRVIGAREPGLTPIVPVVDGIIASCADRLHTLERGLGRALPVPSTP